MTNQDFINIIYQNHKSLVELINVTRTAINAESKASAEMLKIEMKGIQERQDKTNGKIVKLEKECEKTKR